MGSKSYASTLNRNYNNLIKLGIIDDLYSDIINDYIDNNKIENLYMDSIDLLNGNCNKKFTARSHKLHKQAIRLSLICDDNKIPLIYQTDPARKNDAKLGFELASKFKLNDNKIHYLAADKGYLMKIDKKNKLLKDNNLRLITPKKNYKKKKEYKTPNYKHKITRVRHSKQMKDVLNNRIIVEHSNSILHRSFKRLNKIYDRKIESLNGFIKLAIICMIFNHNYK